MENRSIDKGDSGATNMSNKEADEQSRRMAIAESGIYRSMKQHKEAQKKGADLYDRFAKMIAERDGDE